VKLSYYDGSLDEDDVGSVEELDSDDSSSVEKGKAGQKIAPWKCIKCSHVNSTFAYKCHACNAWKDGKRPTKKTPSANAATELPPILQKSHYKPLFEVNDPVYAPWLQSKSNQTWYPGVITGYKTVKNGVYGPVRMYNVRFDDGDQLSNIEDYCIFSQEDYLLSMKKEWIGVVNQLDETSSDSWAKKVGWYEATIGELVSSISLLRRKFCAQ
jgi:hypothetical protein